MEVVQPVDDSGSTKRRKVGNGELRLSSSKSGRIAGITDGGDEDVVVTSENVCNSAETKELRFSSGEIPVKMKCADLEERAKIEIETETETTVRSDLNRRESVPVNQIKTHILSTNLMASYFITPIITPSEFKQEFRELKSMTTKTHPAPVDSRRTIPPEKTPPAAEIEEFFASAEKDLQNRFKNKYNYDIVNDVPLKGRFEWIQLKQ